MTRRHINQGSIFEQQIGYSRAVADDRMKIEIDVTALRPDDS